MVVLNYLYNCKFCQFGGVGRVTTLYLTSPPLKPSFLDPFQLVPWNRSRSRTQITERKGDGTTEIRTNDLVDGPYSRTWNK